MKLTDLIPAPQPAGGDVTLGWNFAIDRMAALIADAEAAGYRLVLAMPQHIEPMGEEV